MAAKKSETVRVQATRNLDLMNAGEAPVVIDRDDQVQRLIDSGDLIEVPEDDNEGSRPL